MPEKVIVSSDGGFTEKSECLGLLRDAGFEPLLKIDDRFSLGHMSDDEQAGVLRGAAAVIAWGDRYPRPILEALPDLRVVARAGVGFDRVDIEAASELDKVITIAPTANYESVAEHALTFIMALAKDIVRGDQGVRAGGWPSVSRRPLRDCTLGILGLGRIGRALAVRALACRMKVIASEPYPDTDFVKTHRIELLEIDQVLARSDYVSLHLPLSDETSGVINLRTLAKMKPGAMLVNTSRGGLIVEADLVEALKSGHLGGAGMDVFEKEPTEPDNPLFKLDNVIHSAHVAGKDTRSMEDMGNEAAQSIIDLSLGKWPQAAVVNRNLKGKWKW